MPSQDVHDQGVQVTRSEAYFCTPYRRRIPQSRGPKAAQRRYWAGSPRRFYLIRFATFFAICSFSSPWKKTNQKKTPVPRFILRVAVAAGARGNSPACWRAQTVRALFPVHHADARRGTKGSKPFTPNSTFTSAFGGCLRAPTLLKATQCCSCFSVVAGRGTSPDKTIPRRLRETSKIKACKFRGGRRTFVRRSDEGRLTTPILDVSRSRLRSAR